MDLHQLSLSSLADFFTYFFTDKNLNSITIAGYRTAIAGHLSSDFHISKHLDYWLDYWLVSIEIDL